MYSMNKYTIFHSIDNRLSKSFIYRYYIHAHFHTEYSACFYYPEHPVPARAIAQRKGDEPR